MGNLSIYIYTAWPFGWPYYKNQNIFQFNETASYEPRHKKPVFGALTVKQIPSIK